MNKTELTVTMADKLNKPKKEVEEFLNAFTDTVTEVPATVAPVFKAGKPFKEAVKKSK